MDHSENLVIQSIGKLEPFMELVNQVRSFSGCRSLGLIRSARLPVAVSLYYELHRPMLLITDRADHARMLADELTFWLPATTIKLLPEPTPLFYEDAAWGQATRIERIQALTTLANYHFPNQEKPQNHPVIVTSARALMTRTLPRRDFLKASKKIKKGQLLKLRSLLESWIRSGYQPVDTVLEPGQISHRGGLLDIWPPAETFPLRLDFFGDEVDEIRRFDSTSQRTIGAMNEIWITPAREFLLGDDLDGREGVKEYSEMDIPVLHPMAESALEYLPGDAIVLLDDKGLVENQFEEHEEAAINLRRESLEDSSLPNDFPIPYLTWSEISDDLAARFCLELGKSALELPVDKSTGSGNAELNELFSFGERFAGRLKPFIEMVSTFISRNDTVMIVSRQSERLKDLWRESRLSIDENKAPIFLESTLSEGWKLKASNNSTFHLITDAEIFGWVRPQSRRQISPVSKEAPEASYADLIPGDWVVHIDYGIGRFTGLVQRSLDGLEREFLGVEYKNGDQVYVPIHQADRITRYLGAGSGDPAMGQLGTQEWQDTKKRVKYAVQEIAADLLDLYARRQVAQGFAFSKDHIWQSELEESFPYVETIDQVRVIADVKKDMESLRPMDRLLCGDVGYGKTEVALRAAFKAVLDGKQVAVLVPTTVLAQQHFDTFSQRLTAFPVRVEMLSRFRTPREQDAILLELAQGAIDIIIGTHRLIQSDVQFKDLGLVIIDEEQRFGVTHKEYLKKLRNEVDVLTLTATPIPRTLYMALTGVRDISQLNTPPEERLPIVTHIGPYSPRLVKQAIQRELDRGGQVFFVHNRVQTIDSMKMHLMKMIPDARIMIAHGQMPEQALASVMHSFTAGEIDVLLCTSIIESGLDIPNANTLIVDRGDTFGLAQLYQLRGRVGRGAVRAYAYFFRHRKRTPTIEGQERLEVISENTQLGSGYSIAMRDLEMRGAGELLGSRQHGYIAMVGLNFYTRLLASAVRSQRIDKGLSIPLAENVLLKDLGLPINVDLPLATGIPASYIVDKSLRLKLYRRLADITDISALEAMKAEFIDRFGDLPQMVIDLFYQVEIKIMARSAGLSSISYDSNQLILRYPQQVDSNGDENIGTKPVPMRNLGTGIRSTKNAYWLVLGKDLDWKNKLLSVLKELMDEP